MKVKLRKATFITLGLGFSLATSASSVEQTIPSKMPELSDNEQVTYLESVSTTDKASEVRFLNPKEAQLLFRVSL
jgi:hypothetical protein